MDRGKYYITTAIAYTSRIPHIGNTYEAVLADAIARYRRLEGYDVYFLTGTDEHGQKIQEQAEKQGRTPQEHVDEIAGEIRRIWDFMGVSYDQFIRTTNPAHAAVVQKIFKRLYEQGDIYKGYYEGFYCKPCESFYTETQVTDGKCPDCGAPVERAREEAYFLKMSRYAERLERYILENPQFIQPESRKNEMLNNFIRPGLQDLCVSRTSFSWGIPVDFDPGHVVYVWIDALSNYITALGYDPEGSGPLYKRYWPADVHLIGKDILRFHTIYWPVMLMALGEPLPKQVFGHPWLLQGENKMSKSKGNVVYAEELVKLFGVDAVRYYMLHEMPFAADGSFTYELIIARINADLANILGNLVNRTVAMVGRYFEGVVPAPSGEKEPVDAELITIAENTAARVSGAMESLHVSDALDEIWALLRRSNKYIDETAPWVLAKDEKTRARLGTVLYNLIECIRIASVLLSAFLPEAAAHMQAQIGAAALTYDTLSPFGATVPGALVGKPEPLFARVDEKAKMAEIGELHGVRDALHGIAEPAPSVKSAEKPEEKPAKEDKAAAKAAQEASSAISASPAAPEGLALIGIEDFQRVELRVAAVTACERVPKSDKLLKLQLDVGNEARQVVSGIAKWYTPEQLVGRHLILVANLKPAKLRGVESQGMILAADNGAGVTGGDADVRVIFADDVLPGSKVR